MLLRIRLMPPPTIAIPRRRSLALLALFSAFMVIVSYLFMLLLAAACVYLPYMALTVKDGPGFQTLVLFIFGLAIAGAILWSVFPRLDKFKPPGLFLDAAGQPQLFAQFEKIAAASGTNA